MQPFLIGSFHLAMRILGSPFFFFSLRLESFFPFHLNNTLSCEYATVYLPTYRRTKLFVSESCHSKVHELGDFKQQRFVVSVLEARTQNQGLGGHASSETCRGPLPHLAQLLVMVVVPLARSHLSAVLCPLVTSSLCVCPHMAVL